MVAARLDVVVVGAANVDLVVHVPSLPAAGETVFGTPLSVFPGGKGLNQAVAVAHLGGRAALVARIGDDAWGRFLVDSLTGAGVDVTAVTCLPGSVTGAAIVQVPPEGDSAVVVARPAGGVPAVSDIDKAADLLAVAPVTVVQLEFTPEVVSRTAAA